MERESSPNRFVISPKTSADLMQLPNTDFQPEPYISKTAAIARDMFANARELTPSIALREVLDLEKRNTFGVVPQWKMLHAIWNGEWMSHLLST